MLTLKGKREEVHEEKKGSFYRMERMQGQFYRQFTLPTAYYCKIKARRVGGDYPEERKNGNQED